MRVIQDIQSALSEMADNFESEAADVAKAIESDMRKTTSKEDVYRLIDTAMEMVESSIGLHQHKSHPECMETIVVTVCALRGVVRGLISEQGGTRDSLVEAVVDSMHDCIQRRVRDMRDKAERIESTVANSPSLLLQMLADFLIEDEGATGGVQAVRMKDIPRGEA